MNQVLIHIVKLHRYGSIFQNIRNMTLKNKLNSNKKVLFIKISPMVLIPKTIWFNVDNIHHKLWIINKTEIGLFDPWNCR